MNVSVDLACTQARMGHAVAYGCAGGDFLELLRGAGVRLYRIEQPHRNLPDFFRANWQLLRAIRDFRPDVLHAHMAAQSVLVQPYRLLGYKFVTTLHNEFDRSAWLMGLAGRVVTVSQTGYESMLRRGVRKNASILYRTVLSAHHGCARISLWPSWLARRCSPSVACIRARGSMICCAHLPSCA